MRLKLVTAVCVVMVLLSAVPALAHFGMIIPSEDVVLEKSQAAIDLTICFIHPMEGQGMDMAKPQAFTVSDGAKSTDLLGSLKEIKILDHKAWQAAYTFKRPGVSWFSVIPEPYWEPAEDCFIQHITKVCVPSFGEEEGWDTPLGLPTEIVPLTRPFGNYAGNVFQGRVLVDGKPAAGVPVEVEYYNKDKDYAAPNEYMITQVVMTGPDGVFAYAAPWAGWWGFAALTEAAQTLKKDGADKSVEMGAVLWTKFLAPERVKK